MKRTGRPQRSILVYRNRADHGVRSGFRADLPHAHDAPLKAARLARPRSSDQLIREMEMSCPADVGRSIAPSAGLADPTSRGYTVRRPRQRGPDPIVDVKVRRSAREINQTERCATVCRGPYHNRAWSSEQEYLYLCSGTLIFPRRAIRSSMIPLAISFHHATATPPSRVVNSHLFISIERHFVLLASVYGW
jgi:hypothetical protein